MTLISIVLVKEEYHKFQWTIPSSVGDLNKATVSGGLLIQ